MNKLKYNSIVTRANSVLRLERALSLVWESAPKLTLANAILAMLLGALPLALLYLMKLIVDSVTAGLTATNKETAFGQILFMIVIASIVALLTALSRSASGIVSEAQAAQVSDHVNDLLHAKSIEVDLEYYENPRYYDTLHRAQNDAPFRPARIVNGLVQIGQSSISLIAVLGLLATVSWAITIVLAITSIPAALVRLIYADRTYQWQRACTKKERQTWYFHWLLTLDDYAKEVRLFELGPVFRNRYRNLRKELRSERLAIITKRSTAEIMAQTVGVVAIFGSFIIIALRTLQGNITLGDLVMYFGALQQGQSYLNGLLSGLAGLYEDNLFLTALYEFLDLEPKLKEPSGYSPVPRPMKEGISFEHVQFSYPGLGAKVLEDINLYITPGQVVALVGENGSGKTTLIKLFCRLYDPTGGKITIDGIDLRDFKRSDLWKEISVILQDYARYNLTAKENIWLGNINMPIDTEGILRAAKLSGADNIIKHLDNGYDTVLGRWFEDGIELSVGEWQKVALARAFLRDSQIIVLDEPTSSLDPRAEEEVIRKFRCLVEGKNAIIISHRLSTVTMADCIYFLKDGRIVESGTHQKLMDLGGEYAQLFEIQARHYR